MAAVHVKDVRFSFLFVCDLNCHQQEWFGHTMINNHVAATFEFAAESGFDNTNACGCTLDLPTTDVPDLVRVGVGDPKV